MVLFAFAFGAILMFIGGAILLDANDPLMILIGAGSIFLGGMISFYFIEWEIKREKKK